MSFLKKRNCVPLILGKGGFGRQLAEWLLNEGWGRAEFLDDAAPNCAGKLRDYTDPALLCKGRPAFAAIGNNVLRVELLQKLAAVGYATPVFISKAASVSPGASLAMGCVVLPQAYVGANVQAGAVLPDFAKVESGQVVVSPWQK